MNYITHASYSATNCQYQLLNQQNTTTKVSLPNDIANRLVEVTTGMIVLGVIGLWLFVF